MSLSHGASLDGNSTHSNGVVRAAACPEGCPGTLIISIHIRVRAVRLEVVIIGDTRRRALLNECKIDLFY